MTSILSMDSFSRMRSHFSWLLCSVFLICSGCRPADNSTIQSQKVTKDQAQKGKVNGVEFTLLTDNEKKDKFSQVKQIFRIFPCKANKAWLTTKATQVVGVINFQEDDFVLGASGNLTPEGVWSVSNNDVRFSSKENILTVEKYFGWEKNIPVGKVRATQEDVDAVNRGCEDLPEKTWALNCRLPDATENSPYMEGKMTFKGGIPKRISLKGIRPNLESDGKVYTFDIDHNPNKPCPVDTV